MSKVILRPILTADTQWAGVKNYKNCYEDIGPYLTRSGVTYHGSDAFSKEDRLRLGEKLNKDLSPGSDYWDSFYIRTTGRDIILETEDPFDELRYLYCKNHRRVKDGIFSNKASANFVLINQDEESKKSNLFNRIKRKAMAAMDKMTTEEMRKALRIFGKSSENISAEVVENRLSDIVEGDPKGFLDKWVDNKSRDTQYLIERAISLNVIRKFKRVYSYGTDTIGHGLEETILFLDDPINQDVRFAIQNAIEGKSVIDKPEVPKVEVPSLKD